MVGHSQWIDPGTCSYRVWNSQDWTQSRNWASCWWSRWKCPTRCQPNKVHQPCQLAHPSFLWTRGPKRPESCPFWDATRPQRLTQRVLPQSSHCSLRGRLWSCHEAWKSWRNLDEWHPWSTSSPCLFPERHASSGQGHHCIQLLEGLKYLNQPWCCQVSLSRRGWLWGGIPCQATPSKEIHSSALWGRGTPTNQDHPKAKEGSHLVWGTSPKERTWTTATSAKCSKND